MGYFEIEHDLFNRRKGKGLLELNHINFLSMLLGYPFVVMVYLFTHDWNVFIFDRSDGCSVGPLLGLVKENESYTQEVIHTVMEQTGLLVESDWIFTRGDADYHSKTCDHNKKVIFVPFSIFLPQEFEVEKNIKLDNELSGFRIMDLLEAEEILNREASLVAREVFRILTGF